MKKIFITVLLVVILCLCACSIYGDINHDGKVDIIDYATVRLSALGLKSESYDLNNDGTTDQADADIIKSIILS